MRKRRPGKLAKTALAIGLAATGCSQVPREMRLAQRREVVANLAAAPPVQLMAQKMLLTRALAQKYLKDPGVGKLCGTLIRQIDAFAKGNEELQKLEEEITREIAERRPFEKYGKALNAKLMELLSLSEAIDYNSRDLQKRATGGKKAPVVPKA